MRKASDNISQEVVLFGMEMESDIKTIYKAAISTYTGKKQKCLKYLCAGLIHSL